MTAPDTVLAISLATLVTWAAWEIREGRRRAARIASTRHARRILAELDDDFRAWDEEVEQWH